MEWLLLLLVLFYIIPKLIRVFGNETFRGPFGRTVRTTPEQKAKRFVYIAAAILLFLLIRSCS